jgi:drug/metabolite transporter (DMT)-like permease
MGNSTAMSRTEWALLLLLSVLWGGSFFFSKVAVAALPPSMGVRSSAFRFG